MGTLIASSSAQVEAKLGETFKNNGKYNYGLVIVVLSLIVMTLLALLIAFGKENKDVNFIEQVGQVEKITIKSKDEEEETERDEKVTIVLKE